MKSCFV